MIPSQTLACIRFISVFGGFAEVSEEWATRTHETKPCVDLEVEVHQTLALSFVKGRPCVPGHLNDALNGYGDYDALIYLWNPSVPLRFDLVVPMHGFCIKSFVLGAGEFCIMKWAVRCDDGAISWYMISLN